MFLSLITFCVISFALGLIVYDKLRPYGDIEAFVMSFLFGVCVYPILGIILSFFNEVVIYFILAIGLFVIGIRINIKKLILPSLKPSKYELLAVVFALLMFGVFYYGGVSYPWLEDGDPNGHAVAASYIAHYHTFSKPADMFIARYMEPYPVGFQLWMGTLAQDGFNIVSTLKFYNYVFIALGILAFFCFVRVLTGDDRLALFSTFILTSIPTFSTRFIFSQAFATTQVIVILYFIALAIKKSNELYLYGGVVLGSLFLTHPTTSAVMGGFIVIWVLFDYAYNNKFNVGFIVLIICGSLIGGSWWLYEFQKYGVANLREQLNLNVLSKGVGFSDPTMRYYSVGDFINSSTNNSIDNMTGVGIAVFAMMFLGCIYFMIERKEYHILLLLWLCFCILGVYSNYLPISLIPSRFWVYMSIPLSVVAGYGLMKFFPMSTSKMQIDLGFVGFLAVSGILLTSAYPKAIVNSEQWGSSRLFTQGDYDTFNYAISNIPIGSKTMDACMYERVWSMNLWDDPLDKESILFKNNNVNTSKYGWDSEGWLKLKLSYINNSYMASGSDIFDSSLTYVHDFLRSKDYKYLFVNSRCIKNGILNNTYEKRINELDSSSLFGIASKSGMERIYEIK